jgi:FkbM family methyltransferase
MDIGAYDGDTLKSLCSRRPISRALLLEPDPSNYSALSQNLKQLIRDFPGIEPLALPLGAGEEFGSFVMTGEGEAASMAGMDQLDNISGHSVTVVPIDEVMPRACFDFVKIDVEGNDLAALKGMQKLLRRSMPVLAVSLYHRPRDIVELPLAIMAIFREIPYSYYIRQHMSNSFETVLYAVPARQAA